MYKFKLVKPYPLWKVEYEEFQYKLIDKRSIFRIYVKPTQESNYINLYNTNSLPWAQIALRKLQDIFDTQIIHILEEGEEYYPMFEINSQVYKTLYTFPEQSCVCGTNIPGNLRYGEFSVDAEKFDYVRDFVFFYERGTCLVKGNQLFIDGDLIYNSQQLKDLCDSINQDFRDLDTMPDKLINYIINKYPDVHNYTCDMYSAYNLERRSTNNE